MNRDKWFMDKAARTIAALPVETRALLGSIGLPVNSVTGQAAVVAQIWHLYAHCESSDSIVKCLKQNLLDCSVEGGVLLQDLVLPVRDQFRSGSLPFPNPWQPTMIYYDLLRYHFQSQLVEGISERLLRRELSTRWNLPEREANQFWRTVCCPVSPFSLAIFDEPGDAITDLLRKIARGDELQAIVTKLLARHAPELAELEDISAMARCLCTIAVLEDRLSDQARAREVIARLREIVQPLSQGILGLSGWEQQLLFPLGDDELFLRHYMATRRKKIFVDDSGVNPLPDHVRGRAEVPPWIHELVFVAGARSAHGIMGPVSQFLCVLDPGDTLDVCKVGTAEVQRDGSRYTRSLLLCDDDDDGVVLEYEYNLQDEAHLEELAWLALAGTFRVDVLCIAPLAEWMTQYGHLEIRKSVSLAMESDERVELRRIATEGLRARCGDDARALEDERNEIRAAHSRSGFALCDLAKSERLFIELTEDSEPFKQAIGSKLFEELSEAKIALCHHYTHKAAMFVTRQDPDASLSAEALASLQDRLVRVRQRARGKVRGLFEDKLTRVAAMLESQDRCFVHLRRSREYLHAMWCRVKGDSLEFGEIDLSYIDIKQINQLTGEWLRATDERSRNTALSRLLDAVGRGIATPIWATLHPLGVKRVVFSPSSELDVVPFHCAPVATEAGRSSFYDVFEELTYAPSARVLAELHRRGPIPVSRCLAVAYDNRSPPIPQVYDEVRELAGMRAGWRLLTEDQATPGRALAEAARHSIVHFACHGEACPEDFYCSGLHLAGNARHKGYLSAALILAEGDFGDVGLVTLSACRTGVSASPPLSVHDWQGLDAAFLAKGARCAVSTLWPIYDGVARAFMKSFYLHLFRGLSVVDAHRGAVDLLRAAGGDRTRPPIPAACRDIATELSDAYSECGVDPEHPGLWGAFRCTGWTWWCPVTPGNRGGRAGGLAQ